MQVAILVCARLSAASDILIKDSANVHRFDGETGAYKGIFATTIETPEGFCYDSLGRFCLTGNTLGSGHLEIEGVGGAPEFSPIYQTPHGITLGPDGTIYGTSNHFTGTAITGVVRFNNRTPTPFITTGVDGAWDIRFGPDGNLYLTENPSSGIRVLRFNGVTGAFIDVFVSGGGLSGAGGLAWTPDGDLLVTSRSTDNVLRYDGITGAFEGAFIAAGSGGLDDPIDVDFSPDGKLYVLGRQGRVRLYDAINGAYLATVVSNNPAGGGTMMGFVLPEPTALGGLVLVPLFMTRSRRLSR